MILAQLFFVVLAALFIVWPFFGRSNESRTNSEAAQLVRIRREANIALYREQQEQLQELRDSGEIDEEEYQLQLAELGQLLLDNAQAPLHSSSATVASGLWLLPLLALLLALSVWAGYRHYGAELDLHITEQLRLLDADTQAQPAQMAELEATIEKRLERNPDSAYYWNLLAQRAAASGDFKVAASHLGRAVEWASEDGWLYGQYAQALFFASDRQFTDAVDLALDRGFALTPDDQTVLGLKGVQAFELGEYSQAMAHWRRAQAGLDSSGPGWQALQSGIDRSAALLSDSGGSVVERQENASAVAIEVEVLLDPALSVAANQTLFIAVVQAGGPPMPIAAQRLSAAQLPLKVVLSERDQLSAGRRLVDASELVVSVRLSATGTATPSAGDIVVRSAPFKLAQGAAAVALTLGSGSD